MLVQHPDLADSDLAGRGGARLVDPRLVVADHWENFERYRPADSDEARELFVAALRRAKLEVTVTVAIADLVGGEESHDVTGCLSELAEEFLQRTVLYEMDGDDSGLSVIAVGKLGGAS